ncbi:uncharacterized protein TNCV_2654051 [Trichonephila clavipes]|nr:uncharacterized protein TNCV_2654051 [Trichonephila clavipes]
MSRTDENLISIYERKILRFIFGGIQEKGIWQRRSNFELYHSYKQSDIVNFIKIQRIKWTGHVARMDEDRFAKNAFNAQPIDTRREGRANLRWMDGIEKDLLVLRIENGRTLTGRRMACGKGFLRRPRPTLGVEPLRKEGSIPKQDFFKCQ